MMKRGIITIDEYGVVSVPSEAVAPIRMNDFEIARLLGITLSSARAHIRAVLKSGACRGDMTMGLSVVGHCSLVPDFFGLDMVIAIAFRVNGFEADAFRKWVLQRIAKSDTLPILVSLRSDCSLFS